MKRITRLEKCQFAMIKGYKYNSETGDVMTPRGVVIKKKVNGYTCLSLYSKGFRFYLYAHHFAWFIINNEVVDLIDHKNRIKTDNSINNLRSTTKQVNALNTKSSGAYLDKRTGRYESLIMINGKHIYLGKYNTRVEAERVHLNYKNNKIQELCK